MNRTLALIVDDQLRQVEVSPEIQAEGEEFFARMDRDMDAGWQMSRDWVDRPDATQRCQIVADRIVDAMSAGKAQLASLLAGYILSRDPRVIRIEVDTAGDMLETRVVRETAPATAALDPEQARARAEQEIAHVYRSGRTWRFASFDPLLGSWVESVAFDSEQAARHMREEAVAERAEELAGGGWG